MLRRLVGMIAPRTTPSVARMARARVDLQHGMSLPAPACLPPLERAIAVLELSGDDPKVALMLGRALRRMAEARHGGIVAQHLRARAVAKLQAQLARSGRASDCDLWLALAEAWAPLPDEPAEAEQALRLTLRQIDACQSALDCAQTEAGQASSRIALARHGLALARHPMCPDAPARVQVALAHAEAALALPDLSGDQRESAEEVGALLRALGGRRPA